MGAGMKFTLPIMVALSDPQ